MQIRKCVLCRKRRKEYLYKITKYGIYGIEQRYRVHGICLKKVLAQPKKYGSKKVDLAVHITELISDRDKKAMEATKQRDLRIRKARKKMELTEIIKRHVWITIDD